MNFSGCARRHESDAGAIYSRPIDPGCIFAGRLFRVPGTPTHIPYALVLGTAGGMMEFIPVVGPLVAAALIFGVALLMSITIGSFSDFSRGLALGAGLLISPRIMGKSMELHPLAAIFGVLAGGEIAGVLGIIFPFRSWPACASCGVGGGSTPRRSASDRSMSTRLAPRLLPEHRPDLDICQRDC